MRNITISLVLCLASVAVPSQWAEAGTSPLARMRTGLSKRIASADQQVQRAFGRHTVGRLLRGGMVVVSGVLLAKGIDLHSQGAYGLSVPMIVGAATTTLTALTAKAYVMRSMVFGTVATIGGAILGAHQEAVTLGTWLGEGITYLGAGLSGTLAMPGDR